MLNKSIFQLVFVFLFSLNVVFAADTHFLLIRHGETDWNKENRTQGQADNPLNAHGIGQAERLAEKIFLHHPDISPFIYSSSLNRAVVTAKKTADRFNAAGFSMTVTEKEGLKEYNFGEADGLLVSERNAKYKPKEAELKKLYPERKERWNVTPIADAESLNDLVRRAHAALAEIANAHEGEKVAIFAHGREINTLIIDSQNLDIEPADYPALPNCAVVHFRYCPDDLEQPLKFIQVEDLLQESTH